MITRELRENRGFARDHHGWVKLSAGFAGLCQHDGMPDDGYSARCPECSGALTRVGTGPVWCMACEWNLGACELPHGVRETRALRRDHRLAFTVNRRVPAELAAPCP